MKSDKRIKKKTAQGNSKSTKYKSKHSSHKKSRGQGTGR